MGGAGSGSKKWILGPTMIIPEPTPEPNRIGTGWNWTIELKLRTELKYKYKKYKHKYRYKFYVDLILFQVFIIQQIKLSYIYSSVYSVLGVDTYT